MYNKTKVISGLSGLVGWRQPFNPALPVLDANNLTSSSNRYFNENPYVKLDYIKDMQDYIDISDTDFNTLLRNTEETAIQNVLDTVFDMPDFIDRQVLYQYANSKTKLESGNKGFVGFEIKISKEKNVAFEISRILLEFDGAGDVELLLFNSAKEMPIFTQKVTISSKFQEVELNWRVDNTNGFYKGDFYLGYLADGLTVTPFKRDYELSDIKSCVTHLLIEEGTFPTQTTAELGDLDNWQNTDNTYGLNPDITVFDDFTDMVIQNKQLFSSAIQMQGAINFIDMYISSLRSNRNNRISEEMISKIFVELNGLDNGMTKQVGLRDKLGAEIKRISKEIMKLKRGYFADGFILNTLS